MEDLLDIFDSVKTCKYRDETYHVRDNGAVFRCSKAGKRKRPLDEKWTFGNLDIKRGYLYLSSETVHRIVATAFHGEQPSEKHVVDHIDTNKQNNRPENLRWITRLENILINPITQSRIIYLYGSIENFLADPSKPLHGTLDQNFEWMRTVSKEESENTRNNLLKWASEGKLPNGGTLGEWIYSSMPKPNVNHVEEYKPQTIPSSATQKNWKTPTEFPNCPIELSENGLSAYKESLTKGSVFSKNVFGESIVKDADINSATSELLVMTKNEQTAPNPYALAKVYIEQDKFVHESIRTFFTSIGAQKQFTLALGLEWEGEDSIDDYM